MQAVWLFQQTASGKLNSAQLGDDLCFPEGELPNTGQQKTRLPATMRCPGVLRF